MWGKGHQVKFSLGLKIGQGRPGMWKILGIARVKKKKWKYVNGYF